MAAPFSPFLPNAGGVLWALMIIVLIIAIAVAAFIDRRYTDFVRYNWLREFEEYNNPQKFRVVAIGLFLFFFSFVFLVGSFLLMSYL